MSGEGAGCGSILAIIPAAPSRAGNGPSRARLMHLVHGIPNLMHRMPHSVQRMEHPICYPDMGGPVGHVCGPGNEGSSAAGSGGVVERVNAVRYAFEDAGKYDVSRALPDMPAKPMPLLPAA